MRSTLRRLVILLLPACSQLSFASDAVRDEYKIGPWLLGMSPAQVQSFAESGPYESVQATGGLETRNALVDGRTTTVSFVFGSAGLGYIQIWKYEGADFESAKNAALEVFDLFSQRFGGAELPRHRVNGARIVDRKDFTAVLLAFVGRSPELFEKWRDEKHIAATLTLDIVPHIQPSNALLHSTILYSSRFRCFYVFIFQDPLGSPRQPAKTDIQTENLEEP